MTQIMQYWITTIQQLRDVYYLELRSEVERN
jgi:hypothetical protein